MLLSNFLSYSGGFGDNGQHNYSPARTLDEEAIKRKMALRRAERAAAGDPYIIFDGDDEFGAFVFEFLLCFACFSSISLLSSGA